MAEIDPVSLRLIVEHGQFLSDMKNVARVVDQRFGAMERNAVSLEQQMRASLGSISSSLKGLAAGAGVGISVGQVASLADAYTRYTNSLKVAGVEGEGLATTQNALYDIAQKYGTELESVGTLYSRLSANSKELGLSEDQLLRLVSGTSAALKVSGQSATEASGALLQLSQALGGSTIQAEEYNSLIDGARPLLQAVANGSDRFGGSIAKLTAAVKDGSVSTQEFVQAGLRGMPELMEQADKASLTLSSSLTVLNNALGKYVGETDQSISASARLSQGIIALSQNLDVIIPALATLAAIVGVRYAGAAAAAAISQTALAAANTRAALTAEVMAGATFQANAALLGEAAAANIATASVTRLSVAQGVAAQTGGVLLAMIGGPYGAAVLALAAGFVLLRTDITDANKATGAFAKAQQESANVSKVAADAAMKLALAHGEAKKQALEAARAEAENIKKKLESARASVALANADLQAAKAASAAALSRAQAALSYGGDAGALGASNTLNSSAKTETAAQANARAAAATVASLEKSLKQVNDSIAAATNSSPIGGGNPDNAKALAKHQQKLADLEKLKVGASGKQLANINKQIDREKAIIGNLQKGVGESAAITAASSSTASHARKRDRSEQELSRLAIEELQARLDLTTNAQDRADLQQDILAEERKQRVAEINQDDDLSAAQKKAALAKIAKLYGPAPTDSGDIPVSPGLLQQSVTRQKEEQLAREALDAAQASAQNDQDLLRAQADLAVTRADRREIELKLLDLAYEQERAEQQAVIDSATASDAQKQIAEARLRILDQLKGYDAERIGRQYESPLEQRRRQVRETAANMGDAIENIELNAVDELTDGLARASTEFLHLGGVAGDVLNSIINDFIRLAAQQAIFGSGGIGSGGGLLGGIGKLFGIAGARAAGGPVSGGQTYLVGENGPELFRAPTSGTIVPNHQLNATAAASMTGVRAAVAGTTGTVAQALHFDLRGAVVTEDLLAQMNQMAQEAAIQGAQGGRALAARDLKAMSRPRM